MKIIPYLAFFVTFAVVFSPEHVSAESPVRVDDIDQPKAEAELPPDSPMSQQEIEAAAALKKNKKKKGDSVYHKNLVAETFAISEILDNHNLTETKSKRRFHGTTLGFITPWNPSGYDASIRFANKLDIVSPCWYAVDTHYKMQRKSYNAQWLKEVAALPEKYRFKIAPRVSFESWTERALNDLFYDVERRRTFAEEVVAHLDFGHGVVLDIGSLLKPDAIATHMLPTLKVIRELLGPWRPIGITVAPPRPLSLPEVDFTALAEVIDAVIVMTYDFSHSAGPTSPVQWLSLAASATTSTAHHETKKKFLLGVNFYGYDYTLPRKAVEPVDGRRYLDILRNHGPKDYVWDDQVAEHHFKYEKEGETHNVYYPTLLSLEERRLMAEKHDVGVSIWELGQGLDYFFDLF